MARPIRIYKYQPFNIQTLANLKNRQVWFSKVNRFNDPFEQAYVIDHNLSDDDVDYIYPRLRDKYVEQGGESAIEDWNRAYTTNGVVNDRFRKEFLEGAVVALAEQNLNEGGVCCLAEANDDILMWAHYADGHRGFCLEFNTSFEPFNKLHRVKYQSEIPTVDPVTLFKDGEEFMQIFTTKFTAWGYEKEWRLFHTEGDTAYGYGVEALARIYFGAEMDSTHRDILCQLLYDSPTEFSHMHISPKKFMVNIEAKGYTPYDYESRSDARSTRAPD